MFFGITFWGDVEKFGEFQDGKIRSHGSNFLASPLGGDVEKVVNFQDRKTRSHGTLFFTRGETSHAWLEKCIITILM